MYGFGGHEEIRQGDAAERPVKADEYREPMPYVVRDLSWELARYLDAEIFPEDASAASNSANGRHGWTRDEDRLAG